MGLYPKKQKSDVTFSGDVTVASGATFDVDGSFGGEYQLLVADGAITVKNGLCLIAKTVAGAVAGTLADPVATTDDYKHLLIVSNQAQANTVTSASSFGGGGAGEDVATFSGAIGDSLELVAYQGKWYVAGAHQCTLA